MCLKVAYRDARPNKDDRKPDTNLAQKIAETKQPSNTDKAGSTNLRLNDMASGNGRGNG